MTQQSQQASHPMQGLQRNDSRNPDRMGMPAAPAPTHQTNNSGSTHPPAYTQSQTNNNNTTSTGLPAPVSQPSNQMSRSQRRCRAGLFVIVGLVIAASVILWLVSLGWLIKEAYNEDRKNGMNATAIL